MTHGGSDLHVHDLAVGLHEPVAHRQRGLETDLRLLHRDHGLLEAHGRVVQLHLALQPRRVVLAAAHRPQRLGQRLLETGALRSLRARQRLAVLGQAGACHGLREIEGLKVHVHGFAPGSGAARVTTARLFRPWQHRNQRRVAQRHELMADRRAVRPFRHGPLPNNRLHPVTRS